MASSNPWLRRSLIITALFIAILMGTPYLIQRAISSWLTDHGGTQVSIRNVDFNPFTATLLLEGLKVSGQRGVPLSIEEASVDVAWLPLLKKRLVVQTAHLEGFTGSVDIRKPEYLALGDIHIPLGASDDGTEDSTKAGKRWAVGLRQVSIENLELAYLDDQLDLDLSIDTLGLAMLAQWSPEIPANITAQGRIEGAPFSIKGKISPFANTPHYQASVSITQLPLKPFAVLAEPMLTRLAGKLSLKSELDLAPSEGGLQYGYRGSLTLEALKAGLGPGEQQEPPVLELEKLEVSEMDITPALFSIDKLHPSGLTLRLHINDQGKLNLGGPSASEKAPPTQTQPEPVMAVAINEILVDGDNIIQFSDDSVRPPFKLKADLRSVSLKQLDTRVPEQNSPISMTASLGDYGSFSLDGWVQPFLDKTGVGLKISAYAVALPAFSAYTRDTLGLKLDSGALDMDLTLASHGGMIDGDAAMKIRQLEVETIASENGLQDKLPVPIDVALDTLRDSNNTIALDIPVTGDINDPDFDVSDAIAKALSGALEKGAMTYLTFALQPYGAIFAVAKFAAKKLGNVKLDPVVFSAGDATLPEAQSPYLDKVAALLKDRPRLSIKVCGFGVAQDLQVLEARADEGVKEGGDTPAEILATLAQQRADNVKNYLIGHPGTAAGQLVACAPRVEPDDLEARSRVELLL